MFLFIIILIIIIIRNSSLLLDTVFLDTYSRKVQEACLTLTALDIKRKTVYMLLRLRLLTAIIDTFVN
jgi:hypothetical protein